jgi:hypothetical protein
MAEIPPSATVNDALLAFANAIFDKCLNCFRKNKKLAS